MVIYKSVEKTCASIAQYSANDARRYREIYDGFLQIKEGVVANMFTPPALSGLLEAAMVNSKQGLAMLRNYRLSPKAFTLENFENPHVRAMILGWAMALQLWPHQEGAGQSFYVMIPVIHGKLGTMTCHDGATPEVSRALGFNGIEVICHPGAIQEVEGVSEPWDFWRFTRRTRAHDNMCYLLCSNWGKVNYAFYPKAFCPGHSMIIDYTGMVLRESPYPEEQIIAATIDIEALRDHRTIANHNMWIDVRTEAFRQIYEKPIYPPNLFPPGKPPKTLADKMEGAKEVYRTLYGRGQFTPPYPYEVEDMPGLFEERIKYPQETGRLRKG